MPHVNKQMISFFLTTKCNLHCIYCYNYEERVAHGAKTISFEFAKLGIDYFFKNNASRHIRFYGPGEPTLELSLMRKITDYAYSQAGDDLSVEIQTNGTFNAEAREWLANNANLVWISFDGPPDIQDHNRPFHNSSKLTSLVIENNITYLLKKSESIMVGARITMSELNIPRQIEMIDYFYKLGIRHIWTNPLFPSVERIPVEQDRERQERFHFDMEIYTEKFIEAYKYAEGKGVFYGSFLTCNFDGKSKYNCRACTPTPHLTPDGYISACDMASLGEDPFHMGVFIYGKWNKSENKLEFDEDKINMLKSRNVDNIAGCKNCEVSENCGGYCLGEIVNETGSLFGRKNKNCSAIKKMAKVIPLNQGNYKYLHP